MAAFVAKKRLTAFHWLPPSTIKGIQFTQQLLSRQPDTERTQGMTTHLLWMKYIWEYSSFFTIEGKINRSPSCFTNIGTAAHLVLENIDDDPNEKAKDLVEFLDA